MVSHLFPTVIVEKLPFADSVVCARRVKSMGLLCLASACWTLGLLCFLQSKATSFPEKGAFHVEKLFHSSAVVDTCGRTPIFFLLNKTSGD